MEAFCAAGWVLQHNIERPLLLQRRKFHLRAYALVVQRVAVAAADAACPDTAGERGPIGDTAMVGSSAQQQPPPRVYLYDRYDVRLAGAAHSEDYRCVLMVCNNRSKIPLNSLCKWI
jgi:hypothetical protein